MQDYSFIGFEIQEFQCLCMTNINHEAKERHPFPDINVYQSQTFIEVRGKCCDSEKTYVVSVYPRKPEELSSIVNDYPALSKKGEPKFRTVKGVRTPLFEIPESIGYMDRNRSGAVWVSPEQIKDMLCLLPILTPLYISLTEFKGEHGRLISHFSLQNVHPDLV